MALPFKTSLAKRRSQIVAIDLGWRTSKAIWARRRGESFDLLQFAVLEAPSYEKNPSASVLAEHLKKLTQAIGYKAKPVALVIGVQDSLLRQVELPMAPVADLRIMLKYNTKNYLQQDLPDYVFDCFVLPPKLGSNPTGESAKSQKCRVLVGGAKKQWLETLQEAAKLAGLDPEEISLNLVGTVNAFEQAHPEAFAKEVVALVDLGFKNSTITLLQHGDLALTRVVALGGDKLTSSLGEALGLNYADAEAVKIALKEDVQPVLQSLLLPLGRELRASLDFFEKQEDKTVTQVFVSGGAARSTFILETLQSELMVPCKNWNPLASFKLLLPPRQMAEAEPSAPLLAAAVGGAVGAF